MTPGPRRSAHPPAVRGLARERARPAPARRRLPGDPRRRRRHPVDRRGDARRRPTTSSPSTAGAGWTRCSPTAPPRSRRSPATGSTSPTELRLLEVAYAARQARARSTSVPDVARRPRGRARVPRPARRHRGVRPEPHRGAAAGRRGAGPRALRATCSASAACSGRPEPRGSCRPRRARAGARGCTPTSWPRPAARSSRRSSGALSADHLAAPSRRGHRRARRARPTATSPSVATLLPATTWFLMHDEPRARRAGSSTRGVPVALATDFNPGHLADAEPAARDDGRLPRAEAHARRRRSPPSTINAAHAVGIGDEVGSIEPGGRRDLAIWRVPDAPARSRTGRPRTSSAPSSSAAASSLERGRAGSTPLR